MEWVYQEENMFASPSRQQYEDSLNRLIAARRDRLTAERTVWAQQILCDPDAARSRFVQMLGWPLAEYTPAQPLQVKETLLYKDDAMSIRRVQLELEKDFWFTGLLFLHDDGQQRPMVICQHGGAGTPELVSGLIPDGSGNYSKLTQRVFNAGANVFAPQLFLWHTELFGCAPGQEGLTRDEIRRPMDASLKNLGGSMIAVELWCLRRSLDWLEKLPCVEPGALGMVGLSYGGQYTLFMAAVEPRLKACLSSCYFNDRNTIEWPDYTWFGAGEKFFDAEIALLARPRKLYIQVSDNDEVFFADGARREWARLQQLSADDLAWVNFRMFKGVHEFDWDNGQVEALMADLTKQM